MKAKEETKTEGGRKGLRNKRVQMMVIDDRFGNGGARKGKEGEEREGEEGKEREQSSKSHRKFTPS